MSLDVKFNFCNKEYLVSSRGGGEGGGGCEKPLNIIFYNLTVPVKSNMWAADMS